MPTASPRPAAEPLPVLPAAPDAPDWLSAAVDGDADAIGRACRALREGDERAAADWHAYHLIGDVMRSSELASAPRHDAAFLAGFRARLADEPVVLAPAAPPRSTRWRTPVAAVASAAGVAVVAGVLVMSRSGGEGPAAAPMAAAPAADTTLVRDGMLRDARIEEFMRVHQGAAGGLSLLPPGVRQVDVTVVAPAPQR